MEAPGRLSPWWKHSVILTVVARFTILIWLAAKTYRTAPPIPERVLL
jgi:nitric oxide reductase large subunit